MPVSLRDTAAVYAATFQSVDHKLAEIISAYASDKHGITAKPCRGINADGRRSAGIGAFKCSGLPQGTSSLSRMISTRISPMIRRSVRIF